MQYSVCFTLQLITLVIKLYEHNRKKNLFIFKSYSWPNQIWSRGDGWLHFRETTPLRDPGSPCITNGFLIIFHHPILCLSLILAMIPETSCELHLNLCDQSQLKSSQSHTCLTAPNTVCTQSKLAQRHTLHQWPPPPAHLISPRVASLHCGSHLLYPYCMSSGSPHWLAHAFIPHFAS